MPSAEPFLCVDFGSTFTKALLVSPDGEVLGAGEHRTTIDTDVMEGFDDLRARLDPSHEAIVLACSSAGGGLRVLVIGQEELVTAEAGRRVALSSGGAVVGVASRPYDDLADSLREAGADVVLLTGGTDGGNPDGILEAATALAASPWRGPVVVAGNAEVADEVVGILADFPTEVADNVLPRIGALEPASARLAVRELFLRHVIGGKQLSSRPEFLQLVRGATPDVVLAGLEALAEAAGLPHGVAVVDVGGATTDVHSVVRLDAETGELAREVVAVTPVTRTVEADLGMRWSAATTASAAVAAGLAGPELVEAAGRRSADPGFLPRTGAELRVEEQLARAAVALAVRRHVGRARVVLSPEGRVVERTGKDLREIDLLVGAGGVFRHASGDATALLADAVGPSADGWQQPEAPALAIDAGHALAALGLLALTHPDTAGALARRMAAGFSG